jgi:serine/threonine protein kinase
MIGKVLGQYRIVESLGKGGMGEVYRARDTRLDRDVALKVLPADAGDDPARGKRFEREAKLIASLNHPNIVTVYAVEEIDGVRFLAMEVVEGKTLDEVIPAGGLPLDLFFEIAIPLADALSSAHAKGITHRDLKPSNVMLDAEGRVKVLDFGLAKLVRTADRSQQETIAADEHVTAEGRILGTVAYMSPEQAEGKPLDPRSDIFSLGVVLYQMATGKRPFAGDTPISTVSAILKETPPAIHKLRSSVPRHLGRVIGRCLEKPPEKRLQTARDVCNELEGLQKEIASGEHAELTQPSVSGTAAPAARSTARAWVGAGVVVVVLALAIYALFFRTPATEQQGVLTSRPLTSLLTSESEGSWSPDGSFFAYSHSASGPSNIAVVSTAGGDPIDLVESDGDDIEPRWSPDNRWIAFASNRGGTTAVYLVPPLGGSLRRLVDIGAAPLSDQLYYALGATPWSNDGRTLLVSRLSEDATMAVWKIDLDSGAQERITQPGPGEIDSFASWSFAGDRIAFCRSGASGASLMVMPAAGGAPRRILSTSEEYLMSSWSPDDRSLVYSSWVSGLWMVDLDGSQRRQLTTRSNGEYGPIVSRAGRILYSTHGHQTDLYVRDLQRNEERRLTFHAFDNFDARFSPDGKAVVYGSTRTGNGEIWVIDLEEGKERRLTDRPGDDAMPDWSPDGKEIAYVAYREDKPELWIADAAGGTSRKVCDHEVADPVRFTPDGSGIGFLATGSAGSSLFVADRANGEAREVLSGVDDYGWYRDGRHVIYTPSAGESANELRVADLETGREAVLLEAAHVELNVAPDGSAVSFCSSKSHFNMNLFVLRLEASPQGGLPSVAGPPEQVTHGEGQWHVHNGGWSPDARRVIYTRDTDTGDVYVLDGVFR